MHAHTYAYTNTHARTRALTHTHLRPCIHTHTHTHIRIHKQHTNTHAHTYAYTNMHARTHARANTHAPTPMHTHAHTHTRARAHTYTISAPPVKKSLPGPCRRFDQAASRNVSSAYRFFIVFPTTFSPLSTSNFLFYKLVHCNIRRDLGTAYNLAKLLFSILLYPL